MVRLVNFQKLIPRKINLLYGNNTIIIIFISGILIGKLCSCYGVYIFQQLQHCIYTGIRDNIDRDMSVAGQELMEKLGRQDSSDDSDEDDRVS